MMQLHLDELLLATKGKLLSRHQELYVGVGTDTRKSLGGQLFIALKGDSFDAHRFLRQAFQQGAAALMVHEQTAETAQLQDKVTIIQVADTLIALQDLAHFRRQKSKAIIVGIAGSNGKTTSKEFSVALLSPLRKVHYSKGSLNNHWGVPFTLLAEPAGTQISLVEMGMNHEGELARLSEIAAPDVVVCTYVGIEHIEYFLTLQKIADAEEEIYRHSPKDATHIYNLDNLYTQKMYRRSCEEFPKRQVLTFSESQNADVQLTVVKSTMHRLTINGVISGLPGSVEVEVFGRQNVVNLMTAASIGLACGLSPSEIWQGLAACKTNWGRNQFLHTSSGAEILFDGYNSNPDSMKALAENIQSIHVAGQKIGVFAEMKELGSLSPELHRQTGRIIGEAQLSQIWFYGEHHADFAQGVRATHFQGQLLCTADYDEAIAEHLAKKLRQGDLVIVKGSRSLRLERFVEKCQPLNFSK